MDNMKFEAFCTLGKEPEQRYTPSGKMVTSVSAAVEVGSGDYKKTEWIQITIWGEKFGNLFCSMVKKGTFVWVSGTPSVNAWSSKDGEVKAQINVSLKDFRLLRGGKSRDESGDEETPYDGDESGE